MNPIPAQANVRTAKIVARADGSPIVTGTVNFYLKALTGTNAGKWWVDSSETWSASEALAKAMTVSGTLGSWTVSIKAGAWIDGVEYLEECAESGSLDVPINRHILCGSVLADVTKLTGSAYKIADTTGNWGTPGTWSDDVEPVAGENIIIRAGVHVTVAASLNLGLFGTLEVQGNGQLNVAADKTVALVPTGWTVANNEGAIALNYGTVSLNADVGTIGTNAANGTVMRNLGTVTTNDGTVMRNDGVVTTNNGTVTHNVGDITTNGTPGIVTYNYAFVTTNNGLIMYGVKGASPTAVAGAASGLAIVGSAMSPSAATVAAAVAAQAVGAAAGSIGKGIADAKTAAERLTAARAAKLDLIVPGRLTILSPISLTGKKLELIRGDDYTTAAGQALTWTDPGTWPDLTGAAVTLTIRDLETDAVVLSKVGVAVPTGTQTVTFQPTHTDTGDLVPGDETCGFDVEAVLSDGTTRVTLVRGLCSVLQDYTREA